MATTEVVSTPALSQELGSLKKYGVEITLPSDLTSNDQFVQQAGKHLRRMQKSVRSVFNSGKPKKERTPAQKAATEKMRQARAASRSKSKDVVTKRFGA